MFDQETDIIITTVQQRTIANQPAIAVKDILAADIPHPLKTFFRADVEAMLYEEIQRQHKTSRFNFNHPEVQNLQNQINSILVLQYSFERSDFLQRLNDTVYLMINYLVRPQWTLTNVVFEKDPVVSGHALTRMLNHFGPYEYLKDIVIRYVHDKNVSSFNREDFSCFLWKIDTEYVRRKTGDELGRILSPLYEFLDYPKNGGYNALPIKALMKYFEDKRITTILQRLEGEIIQGKQNFSRRELGELLEGVRRTSGAFEAEKTAEQSFSKNNVLEPIDLPGKNDQSELSDHDTLSQPLRAIRIDESDRRRFTKKIFLQNETAFSTTIEAIGKLRTWKEASKYIDEIFIRNNIDPYCSEAERFTGLVYQYYHPNN